MPRPVALAGWTVLSLRPRGGHAGLRRAAARHGATLLALSPLAIEPRADAATKQALAQALAADIVLFTSPNAVRAAAALRMLESRRNQSWLAVGASTRAALRRHGIDAIAPSRMDSEGLLALPELHALARRSVGLVTAPGGRGLLHPALRDRGAQVHRADVYARVTAPLTARTLAKLRLALETPRRTLLALSSGDALARLLAGLPDDLQGPLRQVAVATASARLAEAAHQAGFWRIAQAENARPAALMAAAATNCV